MGCRTASPLQPADLKQPGWTVRQGQAVWKRSRSATELAGELTVATREGGRAFLQFVKPPFPLVSLQVSPDGWELQTGSQEKSFAGRGRPPSRLAWTHLLTCLAGLPPPSGWTWLASENATWRLANPRTGEIVEGYFTP